MNVQPNDDFVQIEGETLDYLRKRNILAVHDLADAASISEKTYYNIKRGSRNSKGKSREHVCTMRTIRLLAEALQVSPCLLLLPLEEARKAIEGIDSRSFSGADASIALPAKAFRTFEFDAPSLLIGLREKVASCQALPHYVGQREMIECYKERIKSVCIDLEMHFTKAAAERNQGGTFRYADSSMVDFGILEYQRDRGWASLLNWSGSVAIQYGGNFARSLFVRPRPVTAPEFDALLNVVKSHTRCHHTVNLVDDSELSPELRKKCNLGFMGGDALVAATDQLAWDLDFSTDEKRVSDALDQHVAFSQIPLCQFQPGDEGRLKRVRNVLKDYFPVTEEVPDEVCRFE